MRKVLFLCGSYANDINSLSPLLVYIWTFVYSAFVIKLYNFLFDYWRVQYAELNGWLLHIRCGLDFIIYFIIWLVLPDVNRFHFVLLIAYK